MKAKIKHKTNKFTQGTTVDVIIRGIWVSLVKDNTNNTASVKNNNLLFEDSEFWEG